MAIRDQMPGTKSLSPLYREPVCINVDNDFRTEIRNDVQNLREDLRNLGLRDLRNLIR